MISKLLLESQAARGCNSLVRLSLCRKMFDHSDWLSRVPRAVIHTVLVDFRLLIKKPG